MILTKTSFRVSFAGGGSDLPEFYRRSGGAVLSSTIDKAMYIALHPYFHDKIRIKYSRTEDVASASDIQHPLVRECLSLVGIERGMEIASFADVPAGTGMGSSSAFTVGLLHALYVRAGKNPSAHELATAACEIELERVAAPIGKQDQFAAAYGGLNFIQFHADGKVHVHPVKCSAGTMQELSGRLMFFYIGQERPAASILTEQARNMADKDKFRNVQQMVEVAKSNYRLAREAGAAGGKLLGAGAGGFLMLSCRKTKQGQVREALAALREMPVELTTGGSEVVHNDGRNARATS